MASTQLCHRRALPLLFGRRRSTWRKKHLGIHGGDECLSVICCSRSLEVSTAPYKGHTNNTWLLCSKVSAEVFRMRNLKRRRVDAPRVPTLDDVHPHTTWSMCVRVYHKFHVERFDVSRNRLTMVLLDEKGKKMAVVVYDEQVERFEPFLVEGRLYFVRRISVEPIMRNHDYRFASSHFLCCFTSQTIVREVRTMNDELIPLFPPFMPHDMVWQFTLDNDIYVDVIGMVLYVSSVGFKNSLDDRRIPFRKTYLIDSRYA